MYKPSVRYVLFVLFVSLFCWCPAQAQCTTIFEPGTLLANYGASPFPAKAQTFVPTTNGTICEVQHGVDGINGGITAYNLYIILAPGTGAPPTNYATTNLRAALNQNSFYNFSTLGKVTISPPLNVLAGTRYAIVISAVSGQALWWGNNSGAYTAGQSYTLFGGNWITPYPLDHAFRLMGPVPPPNNDPCTSCIGIGAGTVSGTTVGATTDGAASCGAGSTNDVWYCYTPQCSGVVSLNTCGSFDTVLSVLTACGGTELACNDDCFGTPCFGPGSCLTFNATCGTTYRIRVAAFDALSLGPFTLTLSQAAPAAPANNNIASAINYTGPTSFSTCGATTDGPPGCNPTPFNDVWYRYTPSCTGAIRVSLCGSIFDTVLAVYTGVPGNLSPAPGISCNDDWGPLCSGLPSSVQIAGNPCTPLYIRIGGYGGSTGCGTLTITCVTNVSANDTCATAIPIGPGTTYGTTFGATPSIPSSLTPGPCAIGSISSRDVWYTYTPPCNGQLTIDTCGLPCVGARYDTVLSLYTGSCNAPPLFQVPGACNDNANCGTGYSKSSRVVANVTGGTTYKIRVAGRLMGLGGTTSGPFALQLAFVQPPLTNDTICTAITVPCGTTAFSTCGSTTSPETTTCPVFNDVWYKFTTPNCAGNVTVNTCTSTMLDTVLAVYSGTCALPSLVACNDNATSGFCNGTFWSAITFAGAPSTTYYVRVGAPTNVTGNGVINITCPPGLPTCPPLTGGAIAAVFNVNGTASGGNWAFRISIPCCFDLCNLNVTGVIPSSTGNPVVDQQIDEANLRDRFVNAINAICPGIAIAYPQGTSNPNNYGTFAIKARFCGPTLPPVMASLFVGPPAPFSDCNSLCPVTTGGLPTIGPCSFNPQIELQVLPGTDCNANGEDDYVDILNGTSLDANGNNVPDECDPANPADEPFCFGDGTGTACPCANNSPVGNEEGCLNSSALGGKIFATGSASLSADTTVLEGIQMPSGSPGLYFQGTGQLSGGTGILFGDGLLCAGGSIIRLAVKFAGGTGDSLFPGGGDPSVSSAGLVTSPGVRFYQLYYRDSAFFCTSATFNTTNGQALTWTP